MGTTLDGQSLNILKWAEDVTTIAGQFDSWSSGSGSVVRKLVAYGIIRTYTLDCVEKDIAWASSQVLQFENDASAGTSVTFFSDAALRNVSNVNVKVMGVSVTMEKLGLQNIRYFTVKLQEG